MPTICEIQTCINNLTTSCDAAEFAILATQAVRCTVNNLSFHVATVADLPDLLTANIPNGQMVFVASLGIPVVASKNYLEWRSMDGRLVRKDGFAGVLFTWGLNNSGQLGDGTGVCRSSPVTTAGGGVTWCAISAGLSAHTAAVKTDGTLWTWGLNNSGQLGDGTVVCRSSPGTTSGGGTTWCKVSTGCVHTAAVKTDGTLWTWGQNGAGYLGNNALVARSSPGTTAGGGTTWCAVGAGGAHTSAVKTDGTAWTWGLNTSGQLGEGSIVNRSSPVTTAGSGTDWCQISTGACHTTAVKTNGTVWAWGNNLCGRLGDGTVAGKSSPVTTAGGGTNWCQISAGVSHTAAVKTDGTAWTWGQNCATATPWGSLGDGTVIARSSPGTTVGGGTNWCQIHSGYAHTAAVKTDGTLWTWGRNGYGRLGDGSTINRSSPGTTAGGGNMWCTTSAGQQHTGAICLR